MFETIEQSLRPDIYRKIITDDDIHDLIYVYALYNKGSDAFWFYLKRRLYRYESEK